jgi:hypothetical protein
MPANANGVQIDPTEWNRTDGFSPGITIVLRAPGLDNQAAVQRTGLVPLADLARYQDPEQSVVVIDADTHQRWPIWAELDSNAASDGQRRAYYSSPYSEATQQALEESSRFDSGSRAPTKY